MSNFREELVILINKESIDNKWDVPDFILAQFIDETITAFGEAMQRRDIWFGHKKIKEPYKGEIVQITSSDWYECTGKGWKKMTPEEQLIWSENN